MDRKRWRRRVLDHPLVASGLILAATAGTIRLLDDGAHPWHAIHLTVVGIGAAVVLCVWLVAHESIDRITLVADSVTGPLASLNQRVAELERWRADTVGPRLIDLERRLDNRGATGQEVKPRR